MSAAATVDTKKATTEKIVAFLKTSMECDSEGFFKKDVYTILSEVHCDETMRVQFHDQITHLRDELVKEHGQSPPPTTLKVNLSSQWCHSVSAGPCLGVRDPD